MDDRDGMELAATQHGLITYEQAIASGLTRNQVRVRRDAGILVPFHEGVYRFASVPETWVQQLLAACLATGGCVAVSHQCAAASHGVWSLTDDLVEITVTPDRSPDLDGVLVHRIADLTPRWITAIDGVPVTSPARLIVDLGAVLPLHLVGMVFDRALRRDIVGVSEVRSAIRVLARRGRTGIGIARALVAERSASSARTRLELRMSQLVHQFALPEPVTEHTVLDEHGQFVARVDFAYPELKYAIEVDGYESHSGRRAFEHDRVRQNDLVDEGWTIHRFTWREVEDHPGRIVDRIRTRHAAVLRTLKLPGAA